MIRKLYRLPDKHIVVLRSVLDDALVPRMSTDGVENKWAWAQVARLDDNQCRLTLLVQVKLDHNGNWTAVACARDVVNQMNRRLATVDDSETYDFPLFLRWISGA
ncbi:hypothetical protein AC1031_002262 [Aphanomyces cochlioides]|nr:hypothetical protein AC1031_002262 [Aphanomyces cochlioides]